MAWKAPAMHELRYAFVRSVVTVGLSAAREFGISRKTAFKWLSRWRDDPDLPLSDQSRRPKHSPARTDAQLEQFIGRVRDQYNWGRRRIHAHLLRQGQAMLSIRTVANILSRHGRLQPRQVEPPPQHFERQQPNELWQIDYKVPVEVAGRKIVPFTCWTITPGTCSARWDCRRPSSPTTRSTHIPTFCRMLESPRRRGRPGAEDPPA